MRQLEVLRDQRLRVMPLVLPDGREFSVIFNRADGAPLEAETAVPREVNPGPRRRLPGDVEPAHRAPPAPPCPVLDRHTPPRREFLLGVFPDDHRR